MTDLIATAQVLALCRAEDRPSVLDRILTQAHAADRFCRRFGRPHPLWGNGSLLARALAEPQRKITEDHQFWTSLSLVAATVALRNGASTCR